MSKDLTLSNFYFTTTCQGNNVSNLVFLTKVNIFLLKQYDVWEVWAHQCLEGVNWWKIAIDIYYQKVKYWEVIYDLTISIILECILKNNFILQNTLKIKLSSRRFINILKRSWLLHLYRNRFPSFCKWGIQFAEFHLLPFFRGQTLVKEDKNNFLTNPWMINRKETTTQTSTITLHLSKLFIRNAKKRITDWSKHFAYLFELNESFNNRGIWMY